VLDERVGAARVGQLERPPQRLARLARAALVAQRRPQVRERLRVLEPRA
jgi:hypothetical protein